MNGALVAAFDDLCDPRFGIVPELVERPRTLGAPEWFHATARTCNPAALGGMRGPFAASAAGTRRDAALATALAGAVCRYAAALYERGALPLSTFADATFPALPPRELVLFSDAQYRHPGFPYVPFLAETPVRWTVAREPATGASVYVPAALAWHPFAYFRSAGDLPVLPPTAGGLGCGASIAAAALAGVMDVVAADAAALFWLTMTAPPRVAVDGLPPMLRAVAERFGRAGRLTLLDATTNNRIPAVIALLAADRADAPAFVLAVAADLDPAAAVAAALDRLAEARRRAVDARAARPPPSPANDWEDVADADDHLAFAAAHGNAAHFAFLLASDDVRGLAEREGAAAGPADDLDEAIGRIALSGARVLVADLTGPDLAGLGLAVCRAIVPGYQPLPMGHALRPLGGPRMHEVPQRLGYRGIAQGDGGNPAPHPFG